MSEPEKLVDPEKQLDPRIQPQRRLFTRYLSKDIPPIPAEDERPLYPEETANFVSKIFFWWFNPIMKVGYKRTLQPDDLFKLTENIKVHSLHEKFNTKNTSPKMSLRKALLIRLFKTFAYHFSLSVLFMTTALAASALNPLISRHLITNVELQGPRGKGIGYALGTTGIVCVVGFLQAHSLQKGMIVGGKCKSVLIREIVQKYLRLSEKSRHKYPPGKVTSMLGADLSRIEMSLSFLPVLIAFPVPVIIAIVILIVNIGVSGLVGVALLLAFLMVLTYFTKRLLVLRKSANKFTDQRISAIGEVLNNLRMIKFYSWEIPYYDRIFGARKLEMDILLKMQSLRNVTMAGSLSFTNISSMVSFLVLYKIRNNQNVGAIFASLSLFNVLAQQVYILPLLLAVCADAYIAVGRIAEYLECEETTKEDEWLHEFPEDKELAISISSALFKWLSFDTEEPEETKKEKQQRKKLEKAAEVAKLEPRSSKGSSTLDNSMDSEQEFSGLYDINLDIKKGEFVAITGTVGSGKTSLLYAAAGIMGRESGKMAVDGSLIFCNTPWIQNATVKENILFGSPYDEERYEQVLHNCSLLVDMELFPAGDKTEIGERGVTLSGGQKARINLARAVYANKDIILLDDVLSAVDAKVGKDIMTNCILGFLKGKTRVLATHQIPLVSQADRVIFVKKDGSVDFGTFAELKLRNPDFVTLMEHSSHSLTEDDDQDEAAKKKKEKPKVSGALMAKEDQGTNGLGWDVYRNYLRYGSGSFTSIGWILFYVTNTALAVFCLLFANVWLSFWVDRKFPTLSNGVYIGLYVMFSVITMFFVMNELLSLVYLTNTAAKILHNMGIKRVLYTPMSFMDSTPIGRVMNRFGRDTEVLDNEISEQLRLVSYTLSSIIGIVVLCIVYLPWFAIAVPFITFIFVSTANYYQASSREIKRIESVQRSFVYSVFGEILNGLETIKIFKADNHFLETLEYRIDRMNEANFLTSTNQRWLAVMLNLIASVFTLIITMLCVCSVFNIRASSVGLLLSYVIQITSQLSQLMRAITQVENQMTSVERVNHYAMYLDQEAAYIKNSPDPAWPQKGLIQFKNASMRYRPGMPLVLKSLNLDVAPQEKIGICGRTGAGKSSIMTALFRLAELEEGLIEIDGVDVSFIGLKDLRSKLSIIPQDPVLFKGSIRSNLDPFSESTDTAILEALRKVGLTDAKFNLNHIVEDNGGNYSLGEKQLISFARALVKESRILVLDEATSSIDYQTDKLIQDTIAREFDQCTILCIAHRLKTIINYDRILVLDNGSIAELDTPINLFNRNGIFREMCNKSDIVIGDF